MINPNNIQDLASELSNTLDTIITESMVEKLSPKQRAYLTVLINKWTYGENVIGTIKDILGIKPKQNNYSDKTNWYLKQKGILDK